MQSNASSAWDYLGSVALVVYRPAAIPDAEFREYLAALEQRLEIAATVVVPNGATLTPGQRAEIHHWMERRGARAAVLTDSVVARGAVTALRWFGLAVRAFAEDEVDAALTFAGVAAEELAQGRRLLNVLHGAVAEHRPAAL